MSERKDRAGEAGRPAEQASGAGEALPRRSYIPRPPSQEDVDRVSEAQGMITDEWAGDSPAAEPDNPSYTSRA